MDRTNYVNRDTDDHKVVLLILASTILLLFAC